MRPACARTARSPNRVGMAYINYKVLTSEFSNPTSFQTQKNHQFLTSVDAVRPVFTAESLPQLNVCHWIQRQVGCKDDGCKIDQGCAANVRHRISLKFIRLSKCLFKYCCRQVDWRSLANVQRPSTSKWPLANRIDRHMMPLTPSNRLAVTGSRSNKWQANGQQMASKWPANDQHSLPSSIRSTRSCGAHMWRSTSEASMARSVVRLHRCVSSKFINLKSWARINQ